MRRSPLSKTFRSTGLRRSALSLRRTGLPGLVVGLGIALLLPLGCRRQTPNDVVDAPAVRERAEGFGMAGLAEAVESKGGMVASGHILASRVGADVLERGGNAIDAAVAVGFSLAVVLPRAGNIGGGGFLVYRSADGDVASLDYREEAPAAAHRDMYLDEAGELTDKSIVGHLAAGVPGSVAGLWQMHQRYGSMPWAELLASAIEQADGHTLDLERHENLAAIADRLAEFPASAEQFLPGGVVPREGEAFRQPDLARTLRTIATEGRDGFYRGEVANQIVEEMERGEGVITHADLEAYEAVWRDAIEVPYRNWTIYTMPPPSSGGVTLGLIFNILERWELPRFGTADLLQLEIEAMRRAFIDRNRYLGDPDFVSMPIARLVSQEYADQWAQGIEVGRATPTREFSLEPEPFESEDTTHYSIVDRNGNAVSITTTLNGSFGNLVTVAGAGFLLNNEMDDFAAAPGKPNMFGLVQGEANSIQPGKRMLSSMTPSIVLDAQGELSMVVGSPGGPTIITTVYHVLSNVIDQRMSLQQAIEAPRMHHQSLPDLIFLEKGGLEPAEAEKLEGMGYEIEFREGYSGNAHGVMRVDESWIGVGDPRRAGGAAGPP